MTRQPVFETWHDGCCLSCGCETLGADASLAAPPEVEARDGIGDYYVWCTNEECQHHVGSIVGDQECPPEWAEHTER